MGRHAVQRPRTVVSLAALGAAAALVAGMLSINGAATAEPRRLSDNLVTNPDFESGTAGWNAQAPNTELSVTAGRESRRAAQVTATKPNALLLLNDSPNVITSSKAGTTYVASVWVRADDKTYATLRFREVNGAAFVAKVQVGTVVGGDGWKQLSTEYVAKGNGGEIAVQVLTGRVDAGTSVSIDDFDVRQVLEGGSEAEPEPTKSEEPKPEPTKSEEPKPEPTKSEEPKPEPSSPKGDTLFGASVYTGDGTSFEDALAKSNAKYGGLEVVRVFHPGMPTAWPGKAGKVDGTIVVSFKANPRQVVTGSLDSFFMDWFSKAPRDRDIYWTNYHEPEDNIEGGEFTAGQYRDALRRLDSLADRAGNPRLHTITIWMCYDLKPGSGRDWRDYYPGSDVVDVMGWDCYNRGSDKGEYYSPAFILDDLRKVSESMGKPWGMGEYASKLAVGDNGADRAQWLKDSAAYARQHSALWVNYFDAYGGAVASPEYRLLDGPSAAAWKWAVSLS